MRVLFDNGALHALVPAGRFTITAEGAVEWHTPYSALVTHAGAGDDEVFLPGFDTGDAVDACAFGDKVALAHAGDSPRVDILDRASGRQLRSVNLTAHESIEPAAPRLAGFTPMDPWSDEEKVVGEGPRDIRLTPHARGFFVTAAASGHVINVLDGDIVVTNSLRTPTGAENTIFAVDAGPYGELIGIRWNGRHSELLLVGPKNQLTARWPAPKDDDEEDVRWGMPAPAVIGDYVVTYSDEGPFRKQLALLSLPTLEEVDHVRMPEWPADLATDGKRFAAISAGHLVVGHVENGKLVIDEQRTIGEIMRRAGVGPGPRSRFATNDKRGLRTWLDTSLSKLVVDGDTVIVQGPRGGVLELADESVTPIFEPFPAPTKDGTALQRFFAPQRNLLDAHAGRLVIGREGQLALVERATKADILTVSASGAGLAGLVFADGLLYSVEERAEDGGEEHVIRFIAPQREPIILGRCRRSSSTRILPLSRNGDAAAWFEPGAIAHYRNGEVARHPFTATPRALDGDLTLHDDHLWEGERKVTTSPLPFAVRAFVVAGNSAYFIEPTTTQREGINPSRLWRVDLATGEQSVVSTATIGAISSLSVANGKLWWLEARDASMRFFKLGEDEHVSAVCSLNA